MQEGVREANDIQCSETKATPKTAEAGEEPKERDRVSASVSWQDKTW